MSSHPSLDVDLMKSSDLIKKERLDYGGFGEVYLCYHKTLGHVVLKTVYTGHLRTEQKSSLLMEGSVMTRLSHSRVVKLLGVVLEDGDYSLVMELLPKGNLMAMLKSGDVVMSIKGRIILEILEGMVYLSSRQVIHKDLKPENILVDENFHIKIADLGLATCETWSRLTKAESRKRSGRTSTRPAGTLCYMAPEHLSNINTRSTEKSDVFSFGIVVWVILTEHEPYEHARSEDQICQCVCKGDRPDMDLIPSDAPEEAVALMKQCWNDSPANRPTFKESYDSFRLVYEKKFEGDVDGDLHRLTSLYKGPSETVEKLTSLSLGNSCALEFLEPPSYPPRSGDSPTPLRSSDVGPVEASIDDLRFQTFEGLQADATPGSPATPTNPGIPAIPASVEQKLAQEFNYHKHGSYSRLEQPDLSHAGLAGNRQQGDFFQPSSVQSWTKPSPEDRYPPSSLGPIEERHRPEMKSQMSYDWQPQNSQFERLRSWPGGYAPPMTESASAKDNAGLRVCTSLTNPQTETGTSLYITQASGIQIGNNNTMNFPSTDNYSLGTQFSTTSSSGKYNELLLKHENHFVTEEHLDIVQENVGGKWKMLARKLGLTAVEIETIQHDYAQDGLSEKVHQMLARWKMKEGLRGCTVGSLCRALETCVEPNVLIKLLHKCQEGPVSPNAF